MNHPFHFQNQILYDRLCLFAKDIYIFSGSLPAYENNGLISKLRELVTGLLGAYAEGSVRSPRTNQMQTIDNCLAIVAKIAALVDLCKLLDYTTAANHDKIGFSCSELSKNLYDAKKSFSKG